jgi:hypothetical protein
MIRPRTAYSKGREVGGNRQLPTFRSRAPFAKRLRCPEFVKLCAQRAPQAPAKDSVPSTAEQTETQQC